MFQTDHGSLNQITPRNAPFVYQFCSVRLQVKISTISALLAINPEEFSEGPRLTQAFFRVKY